jgi:pimeloyl-ACP methyl ester carboxylesterase
MQMKTEERISTVVPDGLVLVVLDDASHWVPSQGPDLLADAILERVRG